MSDEWTTADDWFAAFLHRCQRHPAVRKGIALREVFAITPEIRATREYDETTENERRFLAGQRQINERRTA